MIEHLCDLDELNKRKHERGMRQIDDENLLNQKKKPADIIMDEDTGYIGPQRERNNYNTSRLDTSIAKKNTIYDKSRNQRFNARYGLSSSIQNQQSRGLTEILFF